MVTKYIGYSMGDFVYDFHNAREYIWYWPRVSKASHGIKIIYKVIHVNLYISGCCFQSCNEMSIWFLLIIVNQKLAIWLACIWTSLRLDSHSQHLLLKQYSMIWGTWVKHVWKSYFIRLNFSVITKNDIPCYQKNITYYLHKCIKKLWLYGFSEFYSKRL